MHHKVTFWTQLGGNFYIGFFGCNGRPNGRQSYRSYSELSASLLPPSSSPLLPPPPTSGPGHSLTCCAIATPAWKDWCSQGTPKPSYVGMLSTPCPRSTPCRRIPGNGAASWKTLSRHARVPSRSSLWLSQRCGRPCSGPPSPLPRQFAVLVQQQKRGVHLPFLDGCAALCCVSRSGSNAVLGCPNDSGGGSAASLDRRLAGRHHPQIGPDVGLHQIWL